MSLPPVVSDPEMCLNRGNWTPLPHHWEGGVWSEPPLADTLIAICRYCGGRKP